MRAVVLAGGRGTRLGNLTESLPKPMIPIAGKPLLERQLDVLKRYGVTSVILSVGYQANAIEAHFLDGSAFGMDIQYVREETPLGTAGAIKNLERELQQDFLVIYGDVAFDINLERLFAFHFEKESAATLVVHPNDHPHDSDLVEMDWTSRQIKAFHAKPHPPGRSFRNLVNAGAYLLSPRVLPFLSMDKPMDLGRHVFPKLVSELPMFGYNTGEYMKDMGTPERLRQVTHDIESGRVARLNNSRQRRAVFLDRDGVINREVSFIHRVEQLHLLPGVTNSIRKLNETDFLTIVVTNQSVIARGLCTVAELEAIHGYMEGLLGHGHAKLDAIYYCPHHPDRGYPEEIAEFKIVCECRKPKTGLIRQAVAEFNIDVKGSFMVGDSERDIVCGRDAGMRTILVCEDGSVPFAVKPDAVVGSLAEALPLILLSEMVTPPPPP